MDQVPPEIARLFAARQRRRARLATLPFPEKVRAVVRMQQRLHRFSAPEEERSMSGPSID